MNLNSDEMSYFGFPIGEDEILFDEKTTSNELVDEERDFIRIKFDSYNIDLPLDVDKLSEEGTKERLFGFLRYLVSHGYTNVDDLIPYLMQNGFQEKLAVVISQLYRRELLKEIDYAEVEKDEFGFVSFVNKDTYLRFPLNPITLSQPKHFLRVFKFIERYAGFAMVSMGVNVLEEFLVSLGFSKSHSLNLAAAYRMYIIDGLEKAGGNDEYYGSSSISQAILTIQAEVFET